MYIPGEFVIRCVSVKMMVVVTNLGSIFYLVKGKRYVYDKAVALFNEAVGLNNEAKRLKDQLKAVEWAKAEQKRILKEKGERISKELMETMTPFILKQQKYR